MASRSEGQFEPIRDSINSLRTELGGPEPDFAKANKTLEKIRGLVNDYWHGHVPELVQLDVDHTGTAISRGIERKTGKVLDAEFTLWPTMFQLAPGRIDCHAAQVNIDGVIP
jgi:hypothetical protein